MQAHNIFISYSRADSKFALKLSEDLRKAGLSIWIDQSGIKPSVAWDIEIEKALEASDYLLVILSPSSTTSSNVLNEINYALEEKKQILPVVVNSNIKKPLNIRRLQHIDFTGSYDDGFNQLLKALDQEKQIVAKEPFFRMPTLWTPVVYVVIILIAALSQFVCHKNNTVSTSQTITQQTNEGNEGFAKLTLNFGSEGIGPGMFNSVVLFIGLDGKGQIYVGELDGSRVQVFDSVGRFLKQWSFVDSATYFRGMTCDREGNVYAIRSNGVYKYQGETGKLLGKIIEGNWINDIKITLDDGLIVAKGDIDDDNIVHINSDGKIIQIIPKAISTQTGSSESIRDLAIDGVGNIYALSLFAYSVFKFSSAGRFITRFGSKGDETGQFKTYPISIAVDGYGRVYASDIFSIKVFDSDGRYLTNFKCTGVESMIFNERNELFVVTSQYRVIKYKISEKIY